MKNFPRFPIILDALFELGPKQLSLYGLHKLLLKVGVFRWVERIHSIRINREKNKIPPCQLFYTLPDPDVIREVIGPDGISALKIEADEIISGKVRLFGADPVPLDLAPVVNIKHWSSYELGKISNENIGNYSDIKYIWEPARFGWAIKLGRAYHLLRDESYSEAFWNNFEIFLEANPVFMGPNWISAQEVAIRIIVFSFVFHIFVSSIHTTEGRKQKLALSIIEHVKRIPHTLIYARAQNNNHLLSEALGLITASCLLSEHPEAERWGKLGWKWFIRGLDEQIGEDGTYCQHSTNYHRFLIQLLLWANTLDTARFDQNYLWLNKKVRTKINQAALWLLKMCDEQTGQVPNLGPNDGSYILSLTNLNYSDYRPILQASSLIFLNNKAFTFGVWDEMAMWFGSEIERRKWSSSSGADGLEYKIVNDGPIVLHGGDVWGYFRVAHFEARPGHADQLHLDLWWKGLNVARDPGTYLYNDQPPWDNPFTNSTVHNTITIDEQEQMKRVSRFLYLRRAQAEVVRKEVNIDGSLIQIEATHNGFKKLGVFHNRSITILGDNRWLVKDMILQADESYMNAFHNVRLHWLFPDWDWEIEEFKESQLGIHLSSPFGWVKLVVGWEIENHEDRNSDQVISYHRGSFYPRYQLARCGKILCGSGDVPPVMGWFSPTYGEREPALSLAFSVKGELPIHLTSEWSFPE